MPGIKTGTFDRWYRWSVLAVAGLALLQSSACATIARGAHPTQVVVVTSTPSGAQVFVGSQAVGVTPVRLDLERRDSHIVLRFEKEGFAPRHVPVTQSLSGWMALDLFPLNPYIAQGLNSQDQSPTKWQRAGVLTLAFGIDFLTGAAYALPAVVTAELTPIR